MADQQRPTGARAAFWGFVRGFLLCLVVAVAFRIVRDGRALEKEWPFLLIASTGAGVIFAIGRGIAGGILGAFVGGVLGAAVGANYLAPLLPQWNLLSPAESTDEAVGKPFALAGPTVDGKKVDVADYRGKVVLVDFWATWCPPCVAELPNVLAAYEKYHDHGFEVIGVSLDTSQEKLERFTKERKMPWPQVFFEAEDKRGWRSPIAQQHGVNGIPATYLLDQTGNVAATNLRGEEVAQEVARLLGKAEGNESRPGAWKRVTPTTLFLSMAGCGVVMAFAGAFVQRRLTGGTR